MFYGSSARSVKSAACSSYCRERRYVVCLMDCRCDGGVIPGYSVGWTLLIRTANTARKSRYAWLELQCELGHSEFTGYSAESRYSDMMVVFRRNLLRQLGCVVACLALGQITSSLAKSADRPTRAPRGAKVLSVHRFVAVGDGRTDNQAAIQRAFDYAAANKVGVYIPNGVFLHSGALTAKGITISGAGEGAVLKATTY